MIGHRPAADAAGVTTGSTMGATSPSSARRAIGTVASVRAIPAMLERLDRLEAAVGEATRRIDELQESMASLPTVRDDVRRLTEHLTEQLDEISAALDVRSR